MCAMFAMRSDLYHTNQLEEKPELIVFPQS